MVLSYEILYEEERVRFSEIPADIGNIKVNLTEEVRIIEERAYRELCDCFSSKTFSPQDAYENSRKSKI